MLLKNNCTNETGGIKMALDYKKEADQLTVTFDGRMDTGSCMKINDELIKLLDEHEGGVVFDMAEVDYIASSFLRFCGKATISLGIDSFSIIHAQPGIKKVFKISGSV